MKCLLLAAALLVSHPALADQPKTVVVQQNDRRHFEGTWNTVRNRKLDGRMDCFSISTGEKWRARFAGTWRGIKFEYTVDFDGPPEKLVGHPVTIDGARYKWTGSIKDGRFKGTFESQRYDGTFDLKEK
jgi:hypothetical protein